MSPVATDWAGQAARLCLCGIGRDAFPVPVGPSPTTAVRRCRSAGRSSAGRFRVLSLSRFTDSRRTVVPTASRSVSAETLPFGRTVPCPASPSRKSAAVSSYISDRCGSALPPGSGIFPCLPVSVSVETLRFGRTVLAACLRPPRLPPRFGGSLTAPRTGRVRLGISGVGPTATGARHGSPRVSESDLLATPLTGRCVSDSPHLSCPASSRIGKSGPTVAGGWEFAHGACSPSTATSPEFPGPTHSLRTPGSCQL